MLMKFTKMHGIGNDYIYVDCFKETVADPEGLAVHPSFAGCAVWLEYLYTHAIPEEE